MKCYYLYIYVLHLGVPTLPFARATGIGSKQSNLQAAWTYFVSGAENHFMLPGISLGWVG